jgi:hypothetical protein
VCTVERARRERYETNVNQLIQCAHFVALEGVIVPNICLNFKNADTLEKYSTVCVATILRIHRERAFYCYGGSAASFLCQRRLSAVVGSLWMPDFDTLRRH